MPQAPNLAGSLPALDAMHNLGLLEVHSADLLEYLLGTSSGDVLFSPNFAPAQENLYATMAAVSPGRASSMGGEAQAQLALATAMLRERALVGSGDPRAAARDMAESEANQDRLYYGEQQLLVGRTLSVTTPEQRGF